MPALKTVTVSHDLIGRRGRIAGFFLAQARAIRDGQPLRILDIGANDRALERSLSAEKLTQVYHSVDIDPSHHHDFSDIRDVTEQYDLICMSEFIEHLSIEEVVDTCQRGMSLLLPGGKLYISTPNPYHPTRYFGDITHKQHWPPADLFGLLRHIGFARSGIAMYAVRFRDEFSFAGIHRQLVNEARHIAWRLLGLEDRGGIVAIASKARR